MKVTELQQERETQRVEAFSDGVFAIAITLLVLELHVPKPGDLGVESLAAALLHDWQSYVAFVMSFFSILIMWFNHHKLFSHIKRSDNGLMYLNGLLLFTVTAVPWPTALLAEFWGHSQEKSAAVVYCGLMVLLAIAFNALWRYVTYKGRLLGEDADLDEVRKITLQYSFGPVGYGAAFGIAFWDADSAVFLCIALAIFFAFTGCVNLTKSARSRHHVASR